MPRVEKEDTQFVGARIPESLVAEIDAASPNRTALIIRALRLYFGHAPSDEEVAEAERILAAKAQRKEATP